VVVVVGVEVVVVVVGWVEVVVLDRLDERAWSEPRFGVPPHAASRTARHSTGTQMTAR